MPDLRLVCVGTLPFTHECLYGGKPVPKWQRTRDRCGTGEAPLVKVTLHPVDRVQKPRRSVRRMRLEHDPSAVSQPQPERGADAQLAEERLPNSRSEPGCAKGVEVLGYPARIVGTEDGPSQNTALSRGGKLGYRADVQ
jgi:hypothetical protein